MWSDMALYQTIRPPYVEACFSPPERLFLLPPGLACALVNWSSGMLSSIEWCVPIFSWLLGQISFCRYRPMAFEDIFQYASCNTGCTDRPEMGNALAWLLATALVNGIG